jgi:hypothetical protein
MGVNVSTNVATTIQDTYNSQTQIITNKCQNKCSNTRTGSTIVITGGTVGNIDLSQSCDVDTNCVFNSTLNAKVQSIIDTNKAQGNTAENPGFSLFPQSNIQTNVSTTKQSLTNLLTQITDQSCTGEAINKDENTTLIIQGATVGNLNLSQSGTSKLACTMSLMATSDISNKLSEKVDQSNKATSALSTLALYALIGIVIVAICGLLAGILGSKKNSCAPGQSVDAKGQPCPNSSPSGGYSPPNYGGNSITANSRYGSLNVPLRR